MQPQGIQYGASGHVFLVKRKRGDHWYTKYRVRGKQVEKRLGPAWSERGRPPGGYSRDARLRRRSTRPSPTPARARSLSKRLRARRSPPQRRSGCGTARLNAASSPPRFVTTDPPSRRTFSLRSAHGQFTRLQAPRLRSGAPKVSRPVGSVVERRREGLLYRCSGDFDFFSPEEVFALVRAAASEADVDPPRDLRARAEGIRAADESGLRRRDILRHDGGWQRRRPRSGPQTLLFPPVYA